MSVESKKSMGWTIVLMILGVVALYGGPGWLALLIPAALLIWYGVESGMQGGRN